MLGLPVPLILAATRDTLVRCAGATTGGFNGHHHFISRGLVAEVEGDQVRLSANADVAVSFEEEESGS